MAKFTILTPAAASFTTSGGGYDYELEALEGMGVEIIECQPTEKDFIAKAGQADAVYAKGMQFNANACFSLSLSAKSSAKASTSFSSAFFSAAPCN